jgi:hypothetical protein
MSVADFADSHEEFLHLESIDLDNGQFSLSDNIRESMRDKKMQLVLKTQSSGFIKVLYCEN